MSAMSGPVCCQGTMSAMSRPVTREGTMSAMSAQVDVAGRRYSNAPASTVGTQSGKRLEASTMYSLLKKNRPAENSFFFHQNVRIKNPGSLHHLLRIWPEIVLWVQSSKRPVKTCFSRDFQCITSIITYHNIAQHAECSLYFAQHAAILSKIAHAAFCSVRFLPAAVCHLPPAVY
jgi:hypothetical protein